MFLGIPLEQYENLAARRGSGGSGWVLHAKNAVARSGQQLGKLWRVRGRAAVCDLYYCIEKQLITATVSEEVESRTSANFAC